MTPTRFTRMTSPRHPDSTDHGSHLHRGAWRLIVTIIVGALLASGCAMLESKERELTWRPIRTVASWFGGLPAHVQDVYLPVTADGRAERIHAWWWPAEDKHAPVVLYLHGARWNLTGQFRRIAQLRDFGFSVFAIDYRGFGASD